MVTATVRFISQDSYAGSIDDPISLHKYLYANSNPVMYSDPSGYMSIGEMAATGAVIGALSGMIVPNVMSIFYNIVTSGQVTTDVTPAQNLKNILNGMMFGLFFGICAAAFMTWGIIAGIASAINFGLAYIFYLDGQNAAASGQWDVAICSWFFCLFYMVAGFTYISLASMPSNVNNNSESDNSNNTKTVTVGRWMSREEYNKMVETGKVQMSPSDKSTYVAYPANIEAYIKQAKPGTIYVEFEVPESAVNITSQSNGWAVIPGPGSNYDRYNQYKGYPPIDDMPFASNIEIKGDK